MIVFCIFWVRKCNSLSLRLSKQHPSGAHNWIWWPHRPSCCFHSSDVSSWISLWAVREMKILRFLLLALVLGLCLPPASGVGGRGRSPPRSRSPMGRAFDRNHQTRVGPFNSKEKLNWEYFYLLVPKTRPAYKSHWRNRREECQASSRQIWKLLERNQGWPAPVHDQRAGQSVRKWI